MNLDQARCAEHAKYDRVYSKQPGYRMKPQRMGDAVTDLKALPSRGSYLDVSCGRGDMLEQAAALGFSPVQGTEIVPALIDGTRVVHAEAHALPFAGKSWDVATLFDVIEHLIPGDDQLACLELARVARRHIIITANNRPSFSKDRRDDLHINKRHYATWDALLNRWFAPARVTWIKGRRHYISEAWRIDL
jgi:SAM-dependent methyltransferase